MGRYDVKQTDSSLNLVIVFLLVVFAGIGAYFLFQDKEESVKQAQQPLSLPEEPPRIKPPVSTGQALKATEQGETSSTQGAATDDADFPGDAATDTDEQLLEPAALPALAQSDVMFKEDMLKLSKGLAPWLNASDLLTKYLTIVNDFSQGLRIYKHIAFMRIDKPFAASRDQLGLYMGAENYQRYDALVAAINSVDVKSAIAVFQKYRPLMLEVFEEFGYPQGHQLEDLFTKSAAEILETPIIENRIGLLHPSVRYKFSDPKLEKLSPVQKQMLRMGPKNIQIIQQKVRLFIELLVNQRNPQGVTLG